MSTQPLQPPAASTASSLRKALNGVSAVDALASGQRVGDVVVEELLCAGASTVIYRALDQRTQEPVVLREFMPVELAVRGVGGQVHTRLPRVAPAFQSGLQAFLNEARMLSAVQHVALVHVQRFWEQDGTAYMTVPLHRGVTLRHWLSDLGTPPSETWLRELLPPLMDALDTLHAQGCHHRNVTPEKILMQFDHSAGSYLQQRPQPMLLGFGAAQRAIGLSLARSPAAMDNGGFASIEQSDGAITARQGAWTDVYGLCAVLYSAIAGRPPPSSMHRVAHDDMVSARKVGRGRYSPAFLEAIDAGLTVQPERRLQSMHDLRQLLVQPEPTIPGSLDAVPAPGLAPRWPLWVWPASAGALLLLAAAVGALIKP